MADKPTMPARAEAQQVFRQFAWNIAGTLAGAKAQKTASRKPQAARCDHAQAGGGEMSGFAIDAAGRFGGYASLFGIPDQGGDIVMPGAFAKSLGRRGRHGVRMLFQHDPKEPIGLWERIIKDARGLFVAGRLVPGVARASELRALIENRALDGLSIGFRTERASKTGGGLRRLWQIDLWEISIVTFPMMDGARISSAACAGARSAG